jgi:hypothetical protein
MVWQARGEDEDSEWSWVVPRWLVCCAYNIYTQTLQQGFCIPPFANTTVGQTVGGMHANDWVVKG